MKQLANGYAMRRIFCLGLAMGALAVLTGCEEANMAIDQILGRRSPVLSAAPQPSPRSLVPAKKRAAGEKPGSEAEARPGVEQRLVAELESVKSPAPQGKRRTPGQLSPALQADRDEKRVKDIFAVQRNPFKAPTEVLPTECPPSMPLCRFDRSQLKLVGVLQVSEGQFKAMVEDPDGRGYFVTAGMQIGGATVTQVTNKGITLHLHRTHQDVPMPLFSGAREPGEF